MYRDKWHVCLWAASCAGARAALLAQSRYYEGKGFLASDLEKELERAHAWRGQVEIWPRDSVLHIYHSPSLSRLSPTLSLSQSIDQSSGGKAGALLRRYIQTRAYPGRRCQQRKQWRLGLSEWLA